jgi:hypothetical protein
MSTWGGYKLDVDHIVHFVYPFAYFSDEYGGRRILMQSEHYSKKKCGFDVFSILNGYKYIKSNTVEACLIMSQLKNDR